MKYQLIVLRSFAFSPNISGIKGQLILFIWAVSRLPKYKKLLVSINLELE